VGRGLGPAAGLLAGVFGSGWIHADDAERKLGGKAVAMPHKPARAMGSYFTAEDSFEYGHADRDSVFHLIQNY
jgi:hypothetical protein